MQIKRCSYNGIELVRHGRYLVTLATHDILESQEVEIEHKAAARIAKLKRKRVNGIENRAFRRMGVQHA